MDHPHRIIAACGIDCTDCDIRIAPCDAGAAQRIVAWFREMNWLKEGEGITEIIDRSMYCKGCRGDRAVHWSAGCPILKCCVDEKRLSHCSECGEFPCERLKEWAATGTGHTLALERLQKMKHQGSAPAA